MSPLTQGLRYRAACDDDDHVCATTFSAVCRKLVYVDACNSIYEHQNTVADDVTDIFLIFMNSINVLTSTVAVWVQL